MSTHLTSMLFVPGGDEGKLSKLGSLKAPAIIIDLEDAVAVSRKPTARVLVADALAAELTAVPIWVRVNASSPPATVADLDAVARSGLTGIVLPKVESATDVQTLAWYLTALENQRNLVAGSIRIMATVESAAGVQAAEEIAAAGPRVECLIFGAGDFSLDLGLDWPQPAGMSELLLSAKRRLVLASRLAGIAPPHDGAYPMFRDDEGLRAEAEQSRLLGMFGKHAIHPRQVPIIDAVFTPTADQRAHAQRIVTEFDASERDGVGNLDLGGQFIDYPVVERARNLLALARDLNPGEASQAELSGTEA